MATERPGGQGDDRDPRHGLARVRKKTQRAVSMGVDGGRVRLGRREAGEEWACRVDI